MKYLVIENQGECEPEAFLLMGASTKRGQDNQIGQFGTGFCFSISVLMRERIGLIVVSGNIKYTFGTETVRFRSQDFEQITVRKGRHTPVATQFTTEMGEAGGWGVTASLRELISNCYDEPNPSLYLSGEIMDRPGYTRVYVQYTDAVRAAYEEFDKHFTFRRKPLAEGEGWAIYAPWGQGTRVYRRGVLVYEDADTPACYDYRNDSIPVREDRKSDRYECERYSANIMKKMSMEQLGTLIDFLKETEGDTFEGDNNHINWYDDEFTAHVKELVNGRILVTKSQFEQFAAELSSYTCLIMPDRWVSTFGKVDGIKNIGSVVSAVRLKGFTVIDKLLLTSSEYLQLRNGLLFTEQVGIAIDQQKLFVFEAPDGAPLGNAMLDSGDILINRSVLSRSVRDVVKVLFEEFVHLDSQNSDYTRGFQHCLIENWLKSLERFVPIAGGQDIELEQTA